ncbi:uncharacterized protein [Coffea arabica]|uniref:Uncharacterized protein isoform X1 n=1 Tax=Coffea arabica TaxID=13443 RepID=A0A6P6TKW2_COFAR|nr:transcription factor PIF4-like [Coffea arabica]
MANLYDTANCSSSSPDDPDDFSLFLHQIMLRSRTSSSTSFMAQKGNEVQSYPGNQGCGLHLVSGTERISIPEAPSAGLQHWSYGGGFTSPGLGSFCQESGVNVSSSSVSVATMDNDLNDYDCESEGLEVLEEAMVKPTAPYNASKRSRAAEVHNLSEKRRRSRINEKMKALQNLIPNSNKTDKASMLDEAIEYLKQLQLQVQLLTVRNGLSLYPMCLPGVLPSNQVSETRTGYEGNRSLDMSLASALPLKPVTPTNILFNLPDNFKKAKQASDVNQSKLSDSEDAFAPASIIHGNHRPIQFPLPGTSKKGTCMGQKSPNQQANQDLSRRKSVAKHIGAEATGSAALNALPSGLEQNILEAWVLGRDQSGGRLLKNMECKNLLLSQVDGTQTGPSPLVDDSIKAERCDF